MQNVDDLYIYIYIYFFTIPTAFIFAAVFSLSRFGFFSVRQELQALVRELETQLESTSKRMKAIRRAGGGIPGGGRGHPGRPLRGRP